MSQLGVIEQIMQGEILSIRTAFVAKVIKTGMSLLGIDVPDRM